MTTRDVAAVVVHHRSLDTLAGTLALLLADGVQPEKLLVVDNSEEPGKQEELKARLPAGASLILCPNAGYGAAVNLGAAWHEANTPGWQYLLISTHETRPQAGAVGVLRAALAADACTAVAGPVLVTGPEGETLWSDGGYLTRALRLPRHRNHRRPSSGSAGGPPREVTWLDGAFLMTRRGIITGCPIDERFFLYMEETDHHLALGKRGWKVKICPEARVWQESAGIPPYYLTRNVQLFLAKNGTGLQRRVAAPYLILRAVARDAVRHNRPAALRPMLAGLRDGRALAATPLAATPLAPHITVVNPLGGALAHYTKALRRHLLDAGFDVEMRSLLEPSISGKGRLHWVGSYAALLARAGVRSQGRTHVLVTWPVLGFLDLILVKLLCGPATVIYHDPQPLVRSVGSGARSAAVAQRLAGSVPTLVHSEQAALAMRSLGLGGSLRVVAHPAAVHEAAVSPGQEPPRAQPTIRVLGQYKPDRDLQLLEFLAQRLAGSCRLEIVGRGWPDVEGWHVDPRFVSEPELDQLLATASALVIPYTRFFQSGIAVRALEKGVPVVGRAGTSLGDLYGAGSPLLVSDGGPGPEDVDAWLGAIGFALREGRTEAARAAASFRERASREWAEFASNTSR